MDLTLTLTGLGPMLMHNGRLANPLDPYTRGIAEISKKRSKTPEDHAELALREARASLYETEDGIVGLPIENVWASIFAAAKAYKLGATVNRALLFDPVTVPLKIGGKPRKAETWTNDPANIYVTGVKVGTARTMRARPIVRDWTCDVTFQVESDELDIAKFGPVFQRAGRMVGVGDWRPRYGKYEVSL